MSSWHLVKRRLVVLLPTLPGWSEVVAFDGPPVTQDAPTDFITVGFVEGEDFAGSVEPGEEFGDLRVETGTIRSELVCASGDAEIKDLEDRAFSLFDAWHAEVRRDPALGVLAQGSTSSLTVDVQPIQNTGGAEQRLTITLSYLARS